MIILLLALLLGQTQPFTAVTLKAVSSPVVQLNWTASVSPNVTGYNLYRSATTGGPYLKITAAPVASLTYLDTTVASGQTYFYAATAVDGKGNESAYSAEAKAVIK
jgi:fibronectin type 3 domain-containing protein